MSTPIKTTQVKTTTKVAPDANKAKKNKAKKQEKNNSVFEKKPSTTQKIVNKATAVTLTAPAVTAGVLTVIGGFFKGVLTGNINKSLEKSIKAADQGADMLQKMWEGRYF